MTHQRFKLNFLNKRKKTFPRKNDSRDVLEKRTNERVSMNGLNNPNPAANGGDVH